MLTEVLLKKIGPSGIVQSVRHTFNRINGLQSGKIYHYLFFYFLHSSVISISIGLFLKRLNVIKRNILFLLFVMLLVYIFI